MTSAILVTQFSPSAVGHGGNHRGYQIVHDLERAIGAAQVHVCSLPDWERTLPQRSTRSAPFWRRIPSALRRRANRLIENPARMIAGGTRYSPHYYANPQFLAYYAAQVERLPRPLVCVIEHTGFAAIVELNQRLGIPTVACVQNLEALEHGSAPTYAGRAAQQIDFTNELMVLARCRERLFISKVEAGLVGGLGLPSRYYPYMPIGAIADRCLEIRRLRADTPADPGLFLMIGTAGHATTRESFSWFIEQARRYGLPAGVRIVVIGRRTETLVDSGAGITGIECRGWIDQSELDQLMLRAQAMLIPQRTGFGALTRLSEWACAGVPSIVSRHPTYALDVPPGVYTVDDDWESWSAAIAELIHGAPISADYTAWMQTQPAPPIAAAIRAAIHSD